MIESFRALAIQKVALASPYLAEVEEKSVEFIEAYNIRVLKSLSLALKDGHSIVPPQQILDLAESANVLDANALFIGCTGQRLALHIERMEEVLGKPVLTANQVTAWHTLHILGHESRVENWGLLFRMGGTIEVL